MEKPPVRNEAMPDSKPARLARGAAAAGLAVFLLAGLLTNLSAVFQHQLDLFPEPITWRPFLDGRVTAGIAHALSRAPLAETTARLQRGLSWELFADLGPKVRKGCPGWLFLADELRVYPQGEADMRTRADVLVGIRDALATRGIGLLVVSVPDKSRVEVANLCSLERRPVLEPRLHQWDELLQTRNIHNLDLLATLESAQSETGEAVFLRTDTHWNESGAAAAAAETATAAQALITPSPHQRYQTSSRPAAPWPGDLIHLAGLDRWHPLRPLPSESVSVSTIEPEPESGAAGVAANADDLFGDAQLPNIALIGTSYSNTSNFAGFLERQLQAPIGRFAKDGGDFAGAAREYFKSAAFRENPPKLLIWEIPERVLQAPRTQEKIGWPKPD